MSEPIPMPVEEAIGILEGPVVNWRNLKAVHDQQGRPALERTIGVGYGHIADAVETLIAHARLSLDDRK